MKKHSMKHDLYHFFGIKMISIPKWAGPLAFIWLCLLLSLSFGWGSFRLLQLAEHYKNNGGGALFLLSIVSGIISATGTVVSLIGHVDVYLSYIQRDK